MLEGIKSGNYVVMHKPALQTLIKIVNMWADEQKKIDIRLKAVEARMSR